MTFTARIAANFFDAAVVDRPMNEIFALARGGNLAAVAYAMNEPNFIVEARSDGSAETGTLIDLTAALVTFPVGSRRVIQVEMFVNGATEASESGYIHRREVIIGGTTPVLGVNIGAIDTNMAGGVAAFTTTDPLLDFIMATNNVTLRYTNEGAAEINNILLNVWVRRLHRTPLGV